MLFPSRCLTVEVHLSKEDKYLHREVVNAIRRYRQIARQMFAVLLTAQAAGGDVSTKSKDFRVIPNNDRSKKILELVFGKGGKAPLYSFRDFVLKESCPTWRSFVFDSLQREVWSRWNAMDATTNAAKGFLALNGASGVAKYHRLGIAFPRATAKPCLNGHSISLIWDRTIGRLNFQIGRIDAGRWYIYIMISSGEWQHGTFYLNESNGSLRVKITFTQPTERADVHRSRLLRIGFSEDPRRFILLSTVRETVDAISVIEPLAWVHQIQKTKERLVERKRSAGARGQAWSHERSRSKIELLATALALRRTHGCTSWNHCWTRRIADVAVTRRCGTVELSTIPKEFLFSQSWPWFEFFRFLKYKLAERGIFLRVTDAVQASQAP